MKDKIKLAYYCSGGQERGFKRGYESLINYIRGSWDEVELYSENTDNPGMSTFKDMSEKYKEGYKIITSGLPINRVLASVTNTDIIESSDVSKKDPKNIFEKYYLNRKPLKVNSDGLEFEFLPTYHPLYFIESKMQSGVANIINAMRCYLGCTPRENSKVLNISRSFEDLKKFVDRFVKDDKKFYVAYDVETNFRSPVMEDFRITGFSLAFNETEGIYVTLNSSDFNMTDEERKKCLSLLKDVLSHKNSKVIIHNLLMEVPATLNELDYELPESKIDDTLVWSKLINSGRTGGNGLKEQAVYRLGYSDWSDDVGDLNRIKQDIKKELTATDRKGNLKVSIDGYRNEELEGIIKKYYPENYLEVSKELIRKVYETDNVLSYGLIPARVLERYGALDSIATFDLLFKYHKMAKVLGDKFKLDLFNGYELWLESMYASYLLELNSSRWDEKQAASDERAFIKIKEEDLRALLSSDHKSMRDHVMKYLRYDIMVKLFESGDFKPGIESHEKFRGYTGTGKIRYEGSDGKIKNINPNKYEELIDIFNLSVNKLTAETNMEYERLLNTGFSEWYIDKLESVLNPNSNSGKEVVQEVIQDDLVKSSRFIQDVVIYLGSDTYQIDLANKEFNQGELELFDIIRMYDPNSQPDEKLKLYEKIMKKLGEINIGSMLSGMIVTAGNWRMETLDEANMTELYNLYSIAGYDIDKDHGVDSPFARLFHIRRYKKVDKLLTTYIWGNQLGRSQVYVVDKNEFRSGKKLVKRKRQYTPGEKLAENEDLLFKGTWNANSVMSGRWSSGIHTLPAWSDTKRYLSSRFVGGCSVIADFSQAEIRVVARASNEEHLLDAYAKGEDVHMKTAMNIFKKPASEISEVERRFSKMGCLVGNTKIKLMNGTTKTIEEIYEDWMTNRTPFYVPSFDKDHGVAVGRCVNVQLTKYTDKICRVTFDDGNILECTPDHPLLLKGREDKYIQSEKSLNLSVEMVSYDSYGWYNCTIGKKVIKVEMLELDKPIPVFDLSVEKYHNYVVDFCDGSGVYLHNTFHILYGGDPAGFANSYLKGDLSYANKIFDGFYSGYPKLKVWKDSKAEEVKNYGLVTTMTNRYIFLGHEQPGVPTDKILRQSGNAPKVDGHYHSDMVVKRFVNC